MSAWWVYPLRGAGLPDNLGLGRERERERERERQAYFYHRKLRPPRRVATRPRRNQIFDIVGDDDDDTARILCICFAALDDDDRPRGLAAWPGLAWHFQPGRPAEGREGRKRRLQHFDLLQRSRLDVRLGDSRAGHVKSQTWS